MFVDGGSRSAYPFPGFRPCASIASPYLPSRLAGEALPPPLDISPGSRAEWDFNPPDTSAVRHALRTQPPPSRLRSTSRLGRLYDLPCSGDFAPGRGGLRQLLGMSSSPCCRFHPAEVAMPHRSDFGTPFCLRPTEAGSALGSGLSRPHLRSLSLRPGASWSPQGRPCR